MDLQQFTFTGNLGRDPEMRYTPSGKPVTSFSVGSNREFLNAAGQKVKETTWLNVTVWGNMGEACNKYLKKGSKVLVIGTLRPDPATGGPRVWTSNQDGTARANYEVMASYVQFLSTPNTAQASGEAGPFDGGPDDDIPF